jgi:hypothetical protein
VTRGGGVGQGEEAGRDVRSVGHGIFVGRERGVA